MDIRPFIKSVALIAFIIHSTFTASGALADITNSADKFWINRTYQNLSKVDNFQAVTEQSLSNQKTSVISDVIFHAPTGFYQVITQPDLFKGFEVSYYDNTITLHDVSKKTALIITGLQDDNKESALDRVKGIYWYTKEHYEQVFTPSIHVADRLSVGMDLIANGTGVEIKKIEAFVDYHHSLFMQANFIFNNGIEAKIKNTKMSFNKSGLLPSRITLPKDTDMDYWDVSKKGLSNKKISKRINKEIIWPEDLGDNWGFTTKKIFQQQNMNNALAYYHNDAFFLITVATPSNGKKLNEFGIPLPIENTQATLNQYPGFSNVEFNYRGFHYSLLSNIHIESLLSMAKGIASSQ
jgi:hypothetical protein